MSEACGFLRVFIPEIIEMIILYHFITFVLQWSLESAKHSAAYGGVNVTTART